MSSEKNEHVLVHIFEVLAEPIRRRIIEVLASGEHYAGDLEAVVTHEFGVSRSAVHHHLKLLRDHDMVLTYDEWPYRSYGLNDRIIADLTSETRHLAELWSLRIGWRTHTDPLRRSPASNRGYRGRGRDPDLRWGRENVGE